MNKKESGRHEAVPAVLDPIPFPDELEHLDRISEKLDAALQAADETVDRLDKEYMAAKRYMAEYRGEIDPHEMFQNELALKDVDRTGAFAVGIREKLVKLRQSPYFARIDVQRLGETGAAKHYIGRFTFRHENEMLIFDWRAPIASLFYDCEVGPVGYDAPMGRIEGELTRKRQYKIINGALEYVLESSVNIQDDVLQRELSHTSDEKMKSIISTIQKEQNQIIRSEKAGTMIIQGVAGSGKTSIALHRIAFLLYRFQDSLLAENIAILSPNKVFGDYISDVLPELGEESICELGFEDIAQAQLEGVIKFELDRDPMETEDTSWAERVRYKSTLEFVRQLERYLEVVSARVFKPEDYTFGRFAVTADWIQARYCAYQSAPIKKRLERIAADIHDRFALENYMEEEVPRAKAVLKSLNAMLSIKKSFAVYQQFYQWLGRPELLVLPQKQTLEWADVFPFLYLLGEFEGIVENKRMKHLVIDEMQDYTPIQYSVINRLFPCQKTILGDFGQFINPNHLHTLADMRALYPDAGLVELNKSYRSTYEIITFAKQLQQVEKLEPMERHGERPQVIACTDWNDEQGRIKGEVDQFIKSGGQSLGILLKTNSEAKKYYLLLAEDYDLQLISPESTHFSNGISVTSIQMSKGLEFDEVIVPDVDAATYHTQYDRSLLYIAATRAMHKLTILYADRRSPLLPCEH